MLAWSSLDQINALFTMVLAVTGVAAGNGRNKMMKMPKAMAYKLIQSPNLPSVNGPYCMVSFLTRLSANSEIGILQLCQDHWHASTTSWIYRTYR